MARCTPLFLVWKDSGQRIPTSEVAKPGRLRLALASLPMAWSPLALMTYFEPRQRNGLGTTSSIHPDCNIGSTSL